MSLQFGQNLKEAACFCFHSINWHSLGLEDLLPRRLSHMAGKLMLAVGSPSYQPQRSGLDRF